MNKYMFLLAACIATQGVRADVDVTITDKASDEKKVLHLDSVTAAEGSICQVGDSEVLVMLKGEGVESADLLIFVQQEQETTTEDAVATEETRNVEIAVEDRTVLYGEKTEILGLDISAEKVETTEQ